MTGDPNPPPPAPAAADAEGLASVVVIERRDDVAGICGRIDTAPTFAVVIHAPRGNRQASTQLGMRRLVRHAEDTGRVIAIATRSLAIAQIETLKGLEAIDAIAAVPGLDMLYMGPNDMRLTMGMKPNTRVEEPEILAVCDRIVAAARKAGIRSGMFCTNVEDAQAMIARGFDHVTAILDDVLLSAGTGLRKQLP